MLGKCTGSTLSIFFKLQLLLNYKADPNKPDLLNHNTALHYACTENHAQCVVTLLNAGKSMCLHYLLRSCYAPKHIL